MQRKISLSLILVSAALLGIFHAAGTYFYIYWQEPGFDWVVHFLGGFFVMAFLFFIVQGFSEPSSRRLVMVVGICAVALVGVAWEIFEVNTGAALVSLRGYWGNTAGDLLFDIIGGCTAIAYAYVPKPKS